MHPVQSLADAHESPHTHDAPPHLFHMVAQALRAAEPVSPGTAAISVSIEAEVSSVGVGTFVVGLSAQSFDDELLQLRIPGGNTTAGRRQQATP